MNLLYQYLRKIGVSSYNELNEEEKRTYREWELALAGRELTSPEVRAFIERELEDSVNALIDKKLNDREDIFLKMKVDFIKKLIVFLDSPKAEQKAIEQIIKQDL